MHVKKHQTCRICGNSHLTEVLDLGEQYIQGAFEHPDSPSPPRRKVSNRIVRCDTSKDENACGLIQADVSVSPEILYRNYWYQSGISQTMTNHLQNIAKEAIKITGFNNGVVIDIAANDGTLLRGYPDSFKKVGIDPSNIAAKQTDFEIINEVFPTKKLKYDNASIITSIACFYDVNEPYEFVAEIKRILNSDGIWVAEFAYWPSMLENLAYDQILLEHCSHYHLAPFERLLKDNGLKLFRAERTNTNGGSILVYVCHDSCNKYENKDWQENIKKLRFDEFEMELDEQETYDKFAAAVNQSAQDLNDAIQKIVNDGGVVHLYGASTKMNTILEYAGIGPNLVPFAAERSPEKYGASTLSGIRIISEEESRKTATHYLCSLVGFRDEIIRREKTFLDNGGAFIFPLPTLEVIKQ